MESLAPLLADLAVSTAPSLINAFKSSQNTSSDVSPQLSAGISLPSQALPPAPAPPLGSSSSNHGPSVRVPFQHLVSTLNGQESGAYTVTVASLETLTRQTKFYRDAVLESLEVVVFPQFGAYKIPVSVSLVWTPSDISLAYDDILKTPGSTCITLGGLNLVNHGVLTCDLGYVNRIIKCPIPYTNTPRLTIGYFQNPDAVAEKTAATRKGSIFVRGVISLAHPICTP